MQYTNPSLINSLRQGEQVVVYVMGKSSAAGKVTLSLVPLETPRWRWDNVVADGRTPYQGRVMHIADFGALVDIGTERQGLLPADQLCTSKLAVGDVVTAYVYEKRRDTRKFHISLEPFPGIRKAWDDLVADGHTPHDGVVTSIDPTIGVFVDIGYERPGLLPLVGSPSWGAPSAEDLDAISMLLRGSRVTTYVLRKHRKTRRLLLTLQRRTVPLISLDAVDADGQTPWQGVVVGKAASGALVDFGCETSGILTPNQWSGQQEPEIGDRLVVYVLCKTRDTGKVALGLQRCSEPKQRWAAIVADGQTPYEGRVVSVSRYGVFVDIGCECIARLKTPACGQKPDERLNAIKVADSMTVYVVEKRTDKGKVCVSLDRKDARLTRVEDLVVDGQTAYQGFVKNVNDLGVWVDIGSERSAVLLRKYVQPSDHLALDSLSVGDSVSVYLIRRNPTNGRLVLSLRPSPYPRKSVSAMLGSFGSVHVGIVYQVLHEKVHVDFGCEAGGFMDRSTAPPTCIIGDTLRVQVVGFDRAKGSFALTPSQNFEQDTGGRQPAVHTVHSVEFEASSQGPEPSESRPLPQAANQKGRLQSEVQRRLRRNLAQGDIAYNHEIGPGGLLVAWVEVLVLPEVAGRRFQGEPRARKVEAEQSAASRALEHLSSC